MTKIGFKQLSLIACACATLTFTANCTPTKAMRGNFIQDYQLAEIQAGVDTQSDVLKKLGSPTTKATFDDNTWYYIGQETEKRGILDPEVVNERIIVATFQDGVLTYVGDADADRLEIPYVRRQTPTSGNEITAIQQMLGNIGRFNKAAPE